MFNGWLKFPGKKELPGDKWASEDEKYLAERFDLEHITYGGINYLPSGVVPEILVKLTKELDNGRNNT